MQNKKNVKILQNASFCRALTSCIISALIQDKNLVYIRPKPTGQILSHYLVLPVLAIYEENPVTGRFDVYFF